TGVAGFPDVRRVAPDPEELPFRAPDVGKLRGQDYPVAPVSNRLTDQRLVASHPVHVGRVEEVASGVGEAVDHPDRFLVRHLLGVVELAHAHAAQPEGGNAQAAPAQLTFGHRRSFPVDAGEWYGKTPAITPGRRHKAGRSMSNTWATSV